MRKLIIAIDGPAGAGKSTVARLAAQRLCYAYIDTGAMYRAITWKAIYEKVDMDNTILAEMAFNMDLQLVYSDDGTRVYVDQTDVTEAIRTPEVSRLVPVVAQVSGVRQALVDLQRKLAVGGGVVMDGRDIGTHVLPNADIKIFLTASIDERAKRRWLELKAKDIEVNIDQLKQEIADRDKTDSEREISPLIQAKDAVVIDTTHLSIPEAVEKILSLCEGMACCV
ncbi:MAG: Cytidylate kinase [Firmicutes bacterium]|nr:Cytidylate kinase [Bacillota bacterium]